MKNKLGLIIKLEILAQNPFSVVEKSRPWRNVVLERYSTCHQSFALKTTCSSSSGPQITVEDSKTFLNVIGLCFLA